MITSHLDRFRIASVIFVIAALMLGASTASAQTGDGTGDGGSGGALDQNDPPPPPPPDEVPTPDSPPDYVPGPLPDPEPADTPSKGSRFSRQISHTPPTFDYIEGTLYGRTVCGDPYWQYVRVGHPSAGGYWQGATYCSRSDRHIVVYRYEQVYIQGDQLGFLVLRGRMTAPNCRPLRSPALSLVSNDTLYGSGTTSQGVPWRLTSHVTIHTATCV